MERKDIDALVRLMQRRGVAEFTYKHDGTEISVKYGGVSAAQGGAHVVPAAAPASAGPAPAAARAEKPAAEHRVIKAPIVGTFYRAPSPDAPTYANIGDRVKKGQVVCIVEAMKLMNQIESDVDGIVSEILVENGQPVQFGQELFRLLPG